MSELSPPTLNEMIAAQGEAVSAARSGGGPRLVATQEAILRKLIDEARAKGPLGRALALSDVAKPAEGASPLRSLLTPFHIEALRPQAEFNRALVEVLSSVVGAPPSNREWVRRRLTPLADPTAWRVKSHRADATGRIVELTKRTYLKALGPALRRALAAQRTWNERVIDLIATGQFGALDDGLGADPLLGRQRAFNQHVAELLARPPTSEADAVGLVSGISPERAVYVRGVQAMAQGLDCDAGAFSPSPRAALSHAPKTLTWFLPFFNHPFGGVHTIFRFADAWRRTHGVENRFVLYDNPNVTPRELEAKVALICPEPPGTFHVLKTPDAVAELPESDVAIATLWSGAYFVLRHTRARHRAYFIQDYEPLFYPAGTVSALAANTYQLGLFGLFNTQGLFESVTAMHPMKGAWFEPAVDTELFHPRGRRAGQRPVRVFFYGRPSVDRNAFELGLEALRQLKAKLKDEVEIFSAGESWNPGSFGAAGVLENLGVLAYAETANLYRGADVGLVFMFTRHPSYLPLEMMACGVTVVTNRNLANDWLLKHGENCLLSQPTASCVAEQLVAAVQSSALREKISREAAQRMAATRWSEQTEKLWDALSAHCMGRRT